MEIKIAIVDDIPVNRKTINEKLSSFPEIKIVYEAENGLEFIENLNKNHQLIELDIVLMDLEMPKMNGIDAINKAKNISPNIKFIILTVFVDNDKIFEAIKAGAHGYLLKEDNAVNIVDAIKNVHIHNGIPMSPSIARKAMQLMLQNNLAELPKTEESGLSARENEVLKGLVAGKNYKKIGEDLFISPLTVRKHVANIYEKLHVHNKAQIINMAYEKKWI